MSAKKQLEFIHVELKRDTWVNPKMMVSSPNDAVDVIHRLLGNMDREMLACINLTSSGQVINASICSVGTVDQALVSPPEVLRGAMLSGARSMIMLHNHPSGNVLPSQDDLNITRRMATAANIVGVDLLDSIILGRDSLRYSMQEEFPEALNPIELPGETSYAAEAQPVYTSDNNVTVYV